MICVAGGTYDRLEELGLHAGKDVAVAGYDNREMACYEKPPLTTMALPLHDIGYKACQIIIGILTNEEVELDNGNCLVGRAYSLYSGVGECGGGIENGICYLMRRKVLQEGRIVQMRPE